MNFELSGRDDGADAIVLSAGLGGAAAYWAPQLAALGAHFRVVTFDHRGTGNNPGSLPESYTVRHMTADLLQVLDAAGIERAHFMGHALGGLVGIDLARRHPQRLLRLVLVNAWATADRHSERCFDIRLGILRAQGPNAYVEAQPLFLHTARYLSENHDAVLAGIAHGIANFQGADTLLKRIGALRAFDARADLPSINTPTLVAASRDDLLVPWTASRALAEALPAAQFWLAAEGGHAVNVEQPETFNQAALEFLLAGR